MKYQINDEENKNEKKLVKYKQIPGDFDKQNLEMIFKLIGCEKTTIDRIIEREHIDIQNFRKNISLLSKLKCSSIELSFIIANNIDVVTISNKELNTIMSVLIKYFKNTDILKNVVYANSRILSLKGIEQLEKIKKIFLEYGVFLDEDYNLLIENSNILIMDLVRLKDSLTIIKEYTKDEAKFKHLIRMEPSVIGVKNLDLLLEYV